MGNGWIKIADGMPGINKVVEVQDMRGDGGHGVLRLEGDTRHGAQDSRFVFGSPENHLLYNVKALRPLQVASGSVDTTETTPELVNTK